MRSAVKVNITPSTSALKENVTRVKIECDKELSGKTIGYFFLPECFLLFCVRFLINISKTIHHIVQGFQILSDALLRRFERSVKASVKECFQVLSEKEFTPGDFTSYMTAGAVASSQIEGSTLDLNSFYQSKANKTNAKEVTEINDLLTAYEYAKRHELSQKALLVCHQLLSKSFTNITTKQKGKYRQTMVGIHGWNGLVYVAAEANTITGEMNKLFADINLLLNEKLTLKQTLFYASFIHFLFAKIHPFADGNGRVARLLEKWFLVSVLGDAVWSIPSEKYYYDNREAYYSGLHRYQLL